jgi:hypothetical protein
MQAANPLLSKTALALVLSPDLEDHRDAKRVGTVLVLVLEESTISRTRTRTRTRTKDERHVDRR